MSFKVFLPSDMSDVGKNYLRDKGCELRVASAGDEATLIREIAAFDPDALLVRFEAITAAVIDAGPRIRVISRHGIGVDSIDVAHATEKGIWVTNGPWSNVNSVAEGAMMLMLMCARNTYAVDSEFRTGRGDYSVRVRHHGFELEGKTLGLIGLGRIGTSVAKKASHGFGMNVIGYDPLVKADQADPCISVKDTRDEVIRQADVLSLHLPSIPSTQKSIGRDEFAMMKPSAVLINCARGEVVDEDALREALEKGAIRAAGLDVFSPEPPKPDNPLLTMKNVACTPHNLAHTTEALDNMSLHGALGIWEVLSGQTPKWAVNKPEKK